MLDAGGDARWAQLVIADQLFTDLTLLVITNIRVCASLQAELNRKFLHHRNRSLPYFCAATLESQSKQTEGWTTVRNTRITHLRAQSEGIPVSELAAYDHARSDVTRCSTAYRATG